MQLFIPRVPKSGGAKVLVMLHEAQACFPQGDFSLLFNLPWVHYIYSYLENKDSKITRKYYIVISYSIVPYFKHIIHLATKSL